MHQVEIPLSMSSTNTRSFRSSTHYRSDMSRCSLVSGCLPVRTQAGYRRKLWGNGLSFKTGLDSLTEARSIRRDITERSPASRASNRRKWRNRKNGALLRSQSQPRSPGPSRLSSHEGKKEIKIQAPTRMLTAVGDHAHRFANGTPMTKCHCTKLTAPPNQCHLQLQASCTGRFPWTTC